MKKITYGGVSFRVSDELAQHLQGYLVALHVQHETGWFNVPCYPTDSDSATTISINLLPDQPFVIEDAPSTLTAARGTHDAVEDIKKFLSDFVKKNPEMLNES